MIQQLRTWQAIERVDGMQIGEKTVCCLRMQFHVHAVMSQDPRQAMRS